MILRKLTIGGPWEVAAVVNEHGVCALVSEFERMLSDPATAPIACAFCSQFNLIVQRGPSVFTEEVYEQLSDSIFAFKRGQFRAVGFSIDKRFVVCGVAKLVGGAKQIPQSLITYVEHELARYLRFEQDRARAAFSS